MPELLTPRTDTDRFASIDELNARHDQLVARFHENKADAAAIAEAIAFMRRAAATGALLYPDAERSAAQSLLNYWSNVLYRHDVSGDTLPDGDLFDFDPDAGADLTNAEYPFIEPRNLREGPDPAQSRVWSRLVGECLAVLARNRLLAVVGSAGSGRSFLLRTALWPELVHLGIPTGEAKERQSVRALGVITPTEKPLRELVRLLGRGDNNSRVESSVGQLRAHPSWFVEQLAGSAPVALAVDQVSDLFALASEQDAQAFVQALAAFVDAGHFAVVVVEHDTLARLAAFEKLAPRISDAAVLVGFDSTELRQIIEGPARRVGLIFGEGVVERLLRDVQGDPAALALLQFTLRRLWKEREGRLRNHITLESYRRLGGGWVALQRAAEGVYRRPGISITGIKRLFLALLTPQLGSGFTAVPVAPASLADSAVSAEQMEAIAAHFCDAGLLRAVPATEHQPSCVTIAHPALVSHWPRLAEWLDEKRVTLRGRLMLKSAAEEWRISERRSLLWRGSMLMEAKGYPALNPVEDAFLSASERAERRTLWLKRCGVAVCILLLALWGNEMRKGKRAEERNKIAIARESGEKDFALANIDVEKGTQLLEGNDPGMAAVRFANGLIETESAIARMRERRVPPLWSDALRAAIHRQRLSVVMRASPRLAERFPAAVPAGNALSSGPSASDTPVGERQLGGVQAAEDGNHFLTISSLSGGVGGIARLWTLGGANVELASKGGLPANSVAFRPDGYFAAVGFGTAGEGNGAVEVWEVATRERINALATSGAATQLIFSPRRDRLAFVIPKTATQGHEAWVWDRGSDATWKRAAVARINHIAFSPDGERLVISSGDETSQPPGQAEIWSFTASADDATALISLPHSAPVNSASFELNEGVLIVTASGFRDDAAAGEARVWNSKTGEPVTIALRHNKMVNFADFSADGRRIVTASSDATARIWDIRAGRAVLTLPHDGWVFQARFSPDGRHVVTGSRDRQARVWDLATGRLLLPPLHHDGSVSYAAFTGDGRRVVTQSRDAARLWELVTENPAAPVLEMSTAVGEAARSADGAFLATATDVRAGETSRVQVWTSAGERVGAEAQIPGPVTAVVFSRDAERIAAANGPVTGEAELRVWRRGTDQIIGASLRHKRAITAAAISPTDADRILTVSRDAENKPTIVQIWDVQFREAIPLPHSWPVGFAAFSADGKRVVTGSGDSSSRKGEARMFDAESGALIGKPMEHNEPVTFVSFSADMRHVATGSIDDTARVWDAATGAPLCEPLRGLHSADLTVARFSPNGRWLLTASYDSTAMLCEWEKWHAQPRGAAITLPHSGTVNDAAFSDDGGRIATASSDRNARVWATDTGELIAVLPHASEVRSVSFDRPAAHLFTLAFKLWTPPRAAGTESAPVQVQSGVGNRARRLGEARAWKISPENVPATELRTLAEVSTAARVVDKKLVPVSAPDADGNWERLRATYTSRTSQMAPLDYHLREAAVCGSTERWFAAAWHLAAAVRLKDDDVGLLVRCASAFENDDRWREAEDYYSRAIQRFTPDQAKPYYEALLRRSSVRTRLHLWEDALRDCVKLQELDPNDHEPWSQIGLIHLVQAQELTRRGEVEQAKVHWDQSLAAIREAVKRGSHPSPWQRLAALELKLHPETKAAYVEVCQQAVEKFQGDSRIAARLAWPCTLDPANDRALLEKLLPLVLEAVQSAPGNFYRLNSLGALYFRLGRYDEAYETFTQSRKAYAADRAASLLAEINDETIPLAMAELEDGRPFDRVFLAMTCHHLSLRDPQSEVSTRFAAEAQRWLRKAHDAYDAGEQGRGIDAGTPRYPWNHLELSLLLREASRMVAPPQISQQTR